MAGHKEVVISGIAGYFPNCNNVEELKETLFSKTNGITIDSRRWIKDEITTINGTGKIKDIDKFDATFFNAHPKLAEHTDPMTRICLERSIEAIIDAGLSPADLYGSNTAVITGSAISTSEMYGINSRKNSKFSMLGRSKAMQANRLSYALNLSGPSFTMDGGWICGSDGLIKAKEMIENGLTSTAILTVTCLILRPEIQFQFEGINRLNRNDRTKSFSSDADGYNRSEACIVMLLQKGSEAKRSYGTLLGVKSTQFGDHRGHIIEHVGSDFKKCLLDAYEEADVDPATVEFVEAYGCGIKHIDSLELNVMEEVFCTERRKTPLKVGSVKSNLGHCQASGLFMSIIKAIIALDSGYIPPNINYAEPNENVPALKTGKIQVVTEKTPFVGDVIGISSFGIQNAYSHVILGRNPKVKTNDADQPGNDDDYIPRLIFASGRNEENTRETIKKIKSNGNDAEFVALTNNVFANNINSHFYRSFTIFPNIADSRIDDVWNVNLKKRPVWFIFSGMGSQWQGMGSFLMRLPIFAAAVDECDAVLKPLGVDIKHVLSSKDPKLFDNILNSFVGIATVQIGLVDVLKALEVTPDGIIGHSVGELGCAYADGCMTAREMILSAYARGRASAETVLIPGMMAAVGLGYDQIKDRVPRDVDVACRNSATSCTISGPVDSVDEFVERLKSEGIFAKTVNVAGIAYHSRYIQPAGPTLLKYLKEVIAEPKRRSSKWISTSLPESKWDTELAKYSSPEYHTNNLLSSVLFEDALKHVPSDAITIEIAPHGLLQAIVNRALPETVTNISLTRKVFGDSVRILLAAIGKMYASGLNPKIQGLYPPIQFPVARGTPHIHSVPLWDHNERWTSHLVRSALIDGKPGESCISLQLSDSIHLLEYRVHGYHVIPLSYVLHDVWEMFVKMNSKTFADEAVQFQNLRFKNDVYIHPTNSSRCYLMIQWGTGLFEYNFDDEVILSGTVGFPRDIDLNKTFDEPTAFDNTSDDFHGHVSNDEIYAILENNGHSLGDNFKNVTNCSVYKTNIKGYVKWKKDWIYFLDGLLKFPILENLGARRVEAPVSIRQVTIVPSAFENSVDEDVHVDYNAITNEITCHGLKISEVKTSPVTLSKPRSAAVKLEKRVFVPFNGSKCKTVEEFVRDSMDVITEADRLNVDGATGKLIICTPYHYDDPISKLCTALIKQTVDNELSIDSTTMAWDSVRCVTDDDESGRFVTVTDVNYLKDSAKSLADKKCSYVIVWSKRPLRDLNEWRIIMQRELKGDCHLALMKKNILLDGNNVFIKPTNDDYDLSVWTALEKYNSATTTIYIISKSEPRNDVNTHVQEMFRKYKSPKLKFLFILDSDAPEVEADKSFYTRQLSKNLIVNVYKNGQWGWYKRIFLRDLNDDIEVIEYPMFKDFATNSNAKLTVKYLGLHFKDLVVEDRTENEFGPLEYSGYTANNERIMGVTSFEQMSSRIKYDELLSWPVPSAWSLEDAATVPLPYAMSYYVFNVLCVTPRSDKSVLITSGLHPISRAAIAVALAEKRDTYATVESNQRADQLSRIFPTLPRSKILVNTNDGFDIELRLLTKSKGVDLILNCSSGKAFRAALRALAYHGKFFNFSKSDMRNHENIGTRIFLQNTSFFAVSTDMLLNESDRNKQIVRKSFADGLNRGIIKPFRSTALTPPFNIGSIFDAMRTASDTSDTVLLSLNDAKREFNDDVQRDSYQCHRDHVYVVVGNKSDWLDLAEWLVNRGAQKIVVAVKRYLMSSTNCRRFDRLISRNVSVQIESEVNLKPREECLYWLDRVLSSNVLGSIFVVNQLDENKIDNLRHAFERCSYKTAKTSFVCISSNGERICDALKSTGLGAINISWDGPPTRPKNAERLLLPLDTLLQTSATVDSSSFVCSSANMSEWSRQINDVIANFFPASVDELRLMNDKITREAEFVEVPTRSPRLSELKSVIPVFVIPGFRPKLVETFYAKFFYPIFEARLPEDVGSIDELSEKLVTRLKNITNKGYVSLIGESWGGMVALKMAQILEAQGTLVTVSLLEGDPEFLTGWAGNFLSNDNVINKLNTMYGSMASQISKRAERMDGTKLSSSSSSSDNASGNETERALNVICARLRTLLRSKPLPNHLRTKVLIFKYERSFEFRRTNLSDYCSNVPSIYVVPKTDYKSMIVDKETIEAVTDNVVMLYAVGVELPLNEKYEHFYYKLDKTLKYID